MIAPLAESVPPALYGGTERVVSALTEELVRRGHDVTLFASGDSRTSARLVACVPRGIRLDPEIEDDVAPTMIELGEVYSRAAEFDIIHNHVDYFAFPFARLVTTPTLTTTHGRLDLPEVLRVYNSFEEQRLVSISRSQRTHLPHANWVATVHNGIDVSYFHFRPEPGRYLAVVGRISPEKRVDRAIEIARDVGMRLVIAAKVATADRDYFTHAIEPLIRRSRLVEFVGEVNESQKDELMGGAYATLFPIDWPEPFGLTMIESMATGTPVIAYRAGSVPEVVIDGVTGFICDSVKAMVEAIPRISRLDRRDARRHVERNFSAAPMASGYEAVYSLVTQALQVAVPAIDKPAALTFAATDGGARV
jgi:glycosyltransferase involved in cell wall biosynthesis